MTVVVNADKFVGQLADFSKLLREDADTAARGICFLLAENVIIGGRFGNPTGTPVKSGFARGQWTANIDSMQSEESGLDPSGALSLAAAMAVAASLKLGQQFWLSNGAPYIVRLDNGWSQQAPLGMTGPLIANMQLLVDHVVTEITR